MIKKHKLTPWALAAGLLLAAPTHADQSFSLTLDGLYSRNLSGLSGFDNGLGGSLIFEFQPSDSFSVGIGADLLEHFGEPPFTGQALFETVNLSGRYLPLESKGDLRPFITAGVGLNPKIAIPGTSLWPGSYRISAGLGTWYHLSPQWALEIAALYNYYDSPGSSLQALNARLGISCFFGRGARESGAVAQEGKKSPETKVTPAPKSQTRGEQTKSVESAEERVVDVPISKKEMGAPATTAAPSSKSLEAKTKSVITPTPALKETEESSVKDAKNKIAIEDWNEESDEDEDLDAAVPTKAVTSVKKVKPAPAPVLSGSTKPALSKQSASNVPAVSRKPLDVYVFRESDTLWDIAARSDVYGDPELYTLLVNANFKATASDTKIPPGTKLTIPRGLTAKDTMSARMKAWALEYLRWRGKAIDRKIYEQWVEEKEWLRLNPKETGIIEDKSWEIKTEQDPTGEP